MFIRRGLDAVKILTVSSVFPPEFASRVRLANKNGGGIKSRVVYPAVDLISTTLHDNEPDEMNEIGGAFIDHGGNTRCLCLAHFNGDGFVTGGGLGILLGNWDPCP
jgi:hypothetical protein